MLLLLLACSGDPKDSAPIDSSPPGDSGSDSSGGMDSSTDSEPSGDSDPGGDSDPSGDSDPGGDSGGDTGPPPPAPPYVGDINVTDAAMVLIGDERDSVGSDVVAADIDGDGISDYVVGTTANTTGGNKAGGAYVALAPSGAVLLADAPFYAGTGAGAYAGSSVAVAGDTDGDGLAELLVGAPGDVLYNARPSTSAGPGAAYLLSGPWSGGSLADADFILTGDANGDRVGCAVAGPGDLDGDGTDDLLIGAMGTSPNGIYLAGQAVVVLGPASGVHTLADVDLRLTGEEAVDIAGGELAPAGDLNGDGYHDIAIGADADDEAKPGRAYLLYGPFTTDRALADADAVFEGEGDADAAGHVIDVGPDANGDGFGDILVNAYENDRVADNAGAVFLVYGPLSGSRSFADADVRVLGHKGAHHVGEAADLLEDMDGDGTAEVFVATHESDEAWIFYGPLDANQTTSEADAYFYDDGDGTELGWAVGQDPLNPQHIWIAARSYNDGNSSVGQVYVFQP